MKKLLFLGIVFCFFASLALAQEANQGITPTVIAETVILKGYIIDNKCAVSQRLDSLPAFVKTHTKQCALSPESAAGGYCIFAEGNLYIFDKESNAKIIEFLNKKNSTLQVVITAKKTGDRLNLISIANQK